MTEKNEAEARVEAFFFPPHLCVQCLMAAGKELGVCWEPCDGGTP